MCGIVGYTGTKQAVDWLLDGLQTLEYRGYDSAGVVVTSPSGNLHGVKCAGRVAVLRERAAVANLNGCCGIGHTRWATHGAPTDIRTSTAAVASPSCTTASLRTISSSARACYALATLL